MTKLDLSEPHIYVVQVNPNQSHVAEMIEALRELLPQGMILVFHKRRCMVKSCKPRACVIFVGSQCNGSENFRRLVSVLNGRGTWTYVFAQTKEVGERFIRSVGLQDNRFDLFQDFPERMRYYLGLIHKADLCSGGC